MTYKQVATWPTAILDNGEAVQPLVTLEDEYGGVSHIIIDDHCYVLINGSHDCLFSFTAWWYPEAVEALGKHLGSGD